MELAFPYLMLALGFLVTYVLNGIRGEIKEIKTTMSNLEKDLRGGITNLDRRVTIVEARCEMEHKE
jgi:uncharacterized protein YoxC